MQIILVCESDSRSKTDYQYIFATIKEYYAIEKKNIKLSPIYAGGKGNLVRSANKIENKKNMYSGNTEVIVFADRDNNIKDRFNIKKNDEIVKFCKDKGYQLVWFIEEIEEVFLGKSVPPALKVTSATKFLCKDNIKNIDTERLSLSDPVQPGTSNILVILDLFLYQYRKK